MNHRPTFFSDPQRILLIKPSALGDVVHALPVLDRLRQRWPAAQIDWLVTPACAGLIENHPDLHELILFDRRHIGQAGRHPIGSMRELIRLVTQLKSRRFDLVVDLQGLLRSGWLAWQTGAPVRVGFAQARELAWAFYTHRIDAAPIEQHAVLKNLAIADALGRAPGPPVFRFPDNPVARSSIQEKLGAIGRYAVLLPATNWQTKRWPVDKFAALVAPLRARYGLASIIAGGLDAAPLALLIGGDLNLAGKTSLPELVELLRRADVVIANDSGPMHIAAALGRPLVTMFGPTNPARTGPFGRNESVVRLDIVCSPCYSRRCSHTSCLNWLDESVVLSSIGRELSSSNHSAGYEVVEPAGSGAASGPTL